MTTSLWQQASDVGSWGGRLSIEIVEANIFFLHAKIVEQFEDGLIRHGRSADIVLNVCRPGMAGKVIVEQDLVHKAHTVRSKDLVPRIFRLWYGNHFSIDIYEEDIIDIYEEDIYEEAGRKG